MNTEQYSKDTISKLGNAMIYIAERVNFLNKTKLLKLLFMIEEYSVVKYNVPFFCIEFKVWKFGPVAPNVFIDLSEDSVSLFSEYIETVVNPNGAKSICAINKFSDDEFSDNDIDVLNFIIKNFGNKSAEKLVDITHKESSLWGKIVKKENLESHFEKSNHSDYSIDFSTRLNKKTNKFYNEVVNNKKLLEKLKE